MKKCDDRRRPDNDSTQYKANADNEATESQFSLLDLIDHMAQISAEKDYKVFLRTGKIPYTGGQPERSAP
ncbi:hypothetical protein [Novosphingobium aquimarinum]|uniref:hypothetical protein n=1 Tax=Novosphingobium aquimarinum TaxID=2682494 RepID=UPI0012EB8DA8|nr:hypothetical protein [Novosphingobium aquimarinum]